MTPHSLSNQPKAISTYIKELKGLYPDFNWKTTLHSNIIRGNNPDDVTTSIRVIYFQNNKLFDVSISSIDVNDMCTGETITKAFNMLVTKLREKRSKLTETIKMLTPQKTEELSKENDNG